MKAWSQVRACNYCPFKAKIFFFVFGTSDCENTAHTHWTEGCDGNLTMTNWKTGRFQYSILNKVNNKVVYYLFFYPTNFPNSRGGYLIFRSWNYFASRCLKINYFIILICLQNIALNQIRWHAAWSEDLIRYFKSKMN